MIQSRKTWQSTARIARTVLNVAVCRTFMRSVLTVIITRVGGSIARISQIATACLTSEIGGFAGFLTLQRWPRSVRSVFWPALPMALIALRVSFCRDDTDAS